VFESEIRAINDIHLAKIWNDSLKKTEYLDKDLEIFQPHFLYDDPSSTAAAQEMASKIRLRRSEKPMSLLGYLYVLEGSTLGNSMHQPDIVATFKLEGKEGSSYYASYGDEVPARWKTFSETMNTVLKDSPFQEEILLAAHEAFSCLEIFYQTLYPAKEKSHNQHVTQINPEAGNHPIPEDPREIEAALRASQKTWEMFAYYDQRYGKRGKSFSDSDNCWVATIIQLDEKSLLRQVAWFGRVLASRGMPQIMLERNLIFLQEELSKAIPEKSGLYEKYSLAAKFLQVQRLQHISEEKWQTLEAEFIAQVGPEMAREHLNAAKLLLSAICDQKNGIDGVAAELKDWYTKKSNFPTPWRDAVERLMEKAMEA
jgi:heme oxygenase